MKKNSNDGRKVVACTCRRAAWEWISERRLYNLPLPADEECCQCENVANGQSQLPIGGRDALVASATNATGGTRSRASAADAPGGTRLSRPPVGRDDPIAPPLPAASPCVAVAFAAGSLGVSEIGRCAGETRSVSEGRFAVGEPEGCASIRARVLTRRMANCCGVKRQEMVQCFHLKGMSKNERENDEKGIRQKRGGACRNVLAAVVGLCGAGTARQAICEMGWWKGTTSGTT